MTDLEQRAARSLADVSVGKIPTAKDFVVEMHRLVSNSPHVFLSESQRNFLWDLCFRFRRQIRDAAVIQHAKEHVSRVELRKLGVPLSEVAHAPQV